MKPNDIADLRTQLQKQLELLIHEDGLGLEAQKTVKLDQQSVGRLSRMDALQQQAMAKATQTRRSNMRLRIKAALSRIDEEEFGYCMTCGDEIAAKRLQLDPTIATCISCARGD